MPNDRRISSLLELLSGPLSVEKLEKLTRGFQDLAQDRAETSTLFVLQTLAEHLASELAGEAVEYVRFQDLTSEIPERMTRVLAAVEEGRSVTEELDGLVGTFYRNLGLYRSRSP
jgi:hypothetical protein